MLKLIIKMPKGADANLLMTCALALAHYKTSKIYDFKLAPPEIAHYGEYAANVNLPSFEPEYVMHSPASMENYQLGLTEYEVGGDVLDPFLMETLAELQKIIPFEMYFENRGKYDAAEWMYEHPNWLGEINDAALHSLFWQEAIA